MDNRTLCVLLAGFVLQRQLPSPSVSLSLLWCSQLEHQLVRLDFNADDMGNDEIAVIRPLWCS